MSTLSLFAEKSDSVIDSTDRQNTPRDLAHDLGWFDLDPCSNPDSHILARRTYSLEAGQDGLALPWEGSCFVNGPYSDPLPWCERLRAYREPWCALWKLDPTCAWFAELMKSGASWAPFRKRLRFENASNCGSANFASVLVWKHWQPPPAIRGRLWV